MSSNPTQKYPLAEDDLTRNNLEEILTTVARKVIAQDVLPRLDRIEHRLDHLESEVSEIKHRLNQRSQPQTGLRPKSFNCAQCEGHGWIYLPQFRITKPCGCKNRESSKTN